MALFRSSYNGHPQRIITRNLGDNFKWIWLPNTTCLIQEILFQNTDLVAVVIRLRVWNVKAVVPKIKHIFAGKNIAQAEMIRESPNLFAIRGCSSILISNRRRMARNWQIWAVVFYANFNIKEWNAQQHGLHATFFTRNKNIYWHFTSFFHIDMTLVIEILPQVRQGTPYST